MVVVFSLYLFRNVSFICNGNSGKKMYVFIINKYELKVYWREIVRELIIFNGVIFLLNIVVNIFENYKY